MRKVKIMVRNCNNDDNDSKDDGYTKQRKDSRPAGMTGRNTKVK